MKLRSRKSMHVAVALWTGNASGRDLLSGVLQYAQEHKHWNVSLIQLPGEPDTHLDTIIAAGVDGIITSDTENASVARLIRESEAPVVTIEYPVPGKTDGNRFDHLTVHNGAIGELGARYFLSAGRFNSYGFVSDLSDDGIQSAVLGKREEGFAKTITAAGLECRRFSAFRSKGSDNTVERLHEWLVGLPKPAAVMCFYDQLALQVLHACSHLKLKSPSQISVLGVDNDAMLCESAMPPLSSIDPDHRRIGYEMARHLNAMLNGRRMKNSSFRYSEEQVIVRESTKNLSPSATLVRRALNFIAAHAADGIGVDEVVEYLGVSRRLVFLRFREIEGRTIHDAIEGVRLDLAARRLRETGWTVARIARSCGYRHLQTFGTAFRKRFGTTPAGYRAASA